MQLTDGKRFLRTVTGWRPFKHFVNEFSATHANAMFFASRLKKAVKWVVVISHLQTGIPVYRSFLHSEPIIATRGLLGPLLIRRHR